MYNSCKTAFGGWGQWCLHHPKRTWARIWHENHDTHISNSEARFPWGATYINLAKASSTSSFLFFGGPNAVVIIYQCICETLGWSWFKWLVLGISNGQPDASLQRYGGSPIETAPVDSHLKHGLKQPNKSCHILFSMGNNLWSYGIQTCKLVKYHVGVNPFGGETVYQSTLHSESFQTHIMTTSWTKSHATACCLHLYLLMHLRSNLENLLSFSWCDRLPSSRPWPFENCQLQHF